VAELELTGRPLTGATRDASLFVGRDDVLETIEAALGARTNLLLLGERGSGKTSLLRRLARRLEDAEWRVAVVEGRLAASPAELLTLIRARVSPTTVSFGVGEAVSGESQLLLETLRRLHADLDDERRPIAVLLDEVTSPELVHALFGRLRDEIWQLPIAWVVAGDLRDVHVYRRPPADAFFGKAVVLGPLDDEPAVRLLRARIPRKHASDRLLKAIVAQSSRLPRDLLRRATDVVVGGVEPEDAARSREQWDRAVEALGEPARRVVADLEAHGPASASDPSFLARVGFGRSRAAQIFAELERAGLVDASTDRAAGGRPRKVYGLRAEAP
jgi:ABC-type cobalamin/Fe3+-siderophores transport system ATPase subunit